MSERLLPAPRWMSIVLRTAGWYNLAWGIFIVLFPLAPFRWADLPEPNYPEIWQGVGMTVGSLGLGYLIAARDPLRHWPIVLIGLLTKLFGPIGFIIAAANGRFPWIAGLTSIVNDVVWWVPFWLILRRVYTDTLEEHHLQPAPEEFEPTLAAAKCQDGRSLLDVSRERPTLVVFLRHLG